MGQTKGTKALCFSKYLYLFPLLYCQFPNCDPPVEVGGWSVGWERCGEWLFEQQSVKSFRTEIEENTVLPIPVIKFRSDFQTNI